MLPLLLLLFEPLVLPEPLPVLELEEVSGPLDTTRNTVEPLVLWEITLPFATELSDLYYTSYL